jgi:glutathione S-transferase
VLAAVHAAAISCERSGVRCIDGRSIEHVRRDHECHSAKPAHPEKNNFQLSERQRAVRRFDEESRLEDEMITLYGFGRIFPEGRGETKDLRVQWALEELGLPYRFHGLDHTAGELDSDAYSRLSPFHQAPVIDDDGFVIAESAAIVVYLAETAGKLIPGDIQGRTRVGQWCVAAAATVGSILACLDVAEIFDPGKSAPVLHAEVRKLVSRFIGGVERRLRDSEWIAGAEFTVADIMMSSVLRSIRKTDLMEPFPKVKAYYERCMARPAWQRTLALSAERLGMKVDDIR